MGSFFKAIFGSDPVSTAIGAGIGLLQAYGSHSIKQYAIAIGCALLGRVTNEVQAKFGGASSNPQSGFGRIGAMLTLMIVALFTMVGTSFAGVARFAHKHAIKPAGHVVQKTAKLAKKILY